MTLAISRQASNVLVSTSDYNERERETKIVKLLADLSVVVPLPIPRPINSHSCDVCQVHTYRYNYIDFSHLKKIFPKRMRIHLFPVYPSSLRISTICYFAKKKFINRDITNKSNNCVVIRSYVNMYFRS